MKRVLIVELDESFAARLFQVLQDAGEYEVSSARTLREAWLILAQQPQDVAFIPAAEKGNLIRSLRSLRPELPLIAVTERATDPLPGAYQGVVEDVLPRAELGRERVRAAMARAAGDGGRDAGAGAAGGTAAGQLPLVARLQSASVVEKVLTTLVSEGARVLAHHGTLDETEVAAVAALTAGTWKEGLAGQLQFARLPRRVSSLLLYSRPLRGSHVLTLAAQPDMTVARLRAEADALAGTITSEGTPNADADMQTPVVPPLPPADEEEVLFTITWRARRSLPEVLHVPLKRALKKMAVTHGCTLATLTVTGWQIYLVISCPPGRNGEWAARLLREGTERAIQEQFGVDTRLWAPDYRVLPGRHSIHRVAPATSAER